MDLSQSERRISDQQTVPARGSLPSVWIGRNWIYLLVLALGLYAGLPFLAPVFMQIGWPFPARIIYGLYAWQCHQLPQRSFFLFGTRLSYSLAEIQSAWQETSNPLVLRQFIGNPSMGWKVAWSDRMVSMYTSVPVFGLIWYALKRWLASKRLPRLPVWGFILLLLPIALDGFSHFVSEFAGLGNGFRDTNAWLSVLTRNTLPPNFYSGDALGSFNSWMRLISGILFGLGIVWFSFPYIDEWFNDLTQTSEHRGRMSART